MYSAQPGTMARRWLAGHMPLGVALQFFRQGDIRSLVYCNPCDVQYIVENEQLKKLKRNSAGHLIVRPEAWRDQVRPIERTIPNDTVRDIWVDGIDYRQTRQYETMMAAVTTYEQGAVADPARTGAYWCRSKEDVEEYFRKLLNTWETISTKGYKSQSELAETNSTGEHSLGDELNLLINSDRNPVFLASGANHRFSMCRLLGLTKVPCRIRLLDHEWLLPALNSFPRGFHARMNRLMDVVQEHLNSSQAEGLTR